MVPNIRTHSEKSINIGFIFTFVAFFGLANIIVSIVRGEHRRDAYIVRLFSYLWKNSGTVG